MDQAPPGTNYNYVSDQLAEITNINGSGSASANYQPAASFNCNTYINHLNGLAAAGEGSAVNSIDHFSLWNDHLLSCSFSQITGGDLDPPPLSDNVEIAHFDDNIIEPYFAASLPASPLPDGINTILSNSSGSAIPAPATCSVPLQGSSTTGNLHEPHIHYVLERTLSLVNVLTDDDFLPDLAQYPPNYASDQLVANVPDFIHQIHGPPGAPQAVGPHVDELVENPSNEKPLQARPLATACNIRPTYSTENMSHNEKVANSDSAELMEFSLSYQPAWQKHPKESASICNGDPVSPKWPASVTSKEDSGPEEVFEMAEGNMVSTALGPNEETSKRKRDFDCKMKDKVARRDQQYASGGGPIERTRKESSCGARTTSIAAHDLVDPSSIAGVANAAYLLRADGEEMNPSNEETSRVRLWVKTKELNLDDGFVWRKYGQKPITKDWPQMSTRSYYSCADAQGSNCKAVKYVRRYCPEIVEYLYLGRHNHPAQPSASHN